MRLSTNTLLVSRILDDNEDLDEMPEEEEAEEETAEENE